MPNDPRFASVAGSGPAVGQWTLRAPAGGPANLRVQAHDASGARGQAQATDAATAALDRRVAQGQAPVQALARSGWPVGALNSCCRQPARAFGERAAQIGAAARAGEADAAVDRAELLVQPAQLLGLDPLVPAVERPEDLEPHLAAGQLIYLARNVLHGVAALEAEFVHRFPFLSGASHRIVRAYGTTALAIFVGASCLADCGRDFGHGLTEQEVRHLITREWARTAEDVLWRRTKLGLRFGPEEAASLDEFIKQECPQ